jgi:excisionase family DNA binding protein
MCAHAPGRAVRDIARVVSQLTGVPTRTIQRWAHDGRITTIQRRGKTLVDPTEVSQLAEHRHHGRLPRTPRS